jgi:DNA-binding GntR family transcriptional regulator
MRNAADRIASGMSLVYCIPDCDLARAGGVAQKNLKLRPINVSVVLKDKVYDALKSAITSMDIYADEMPPRLDERGLAEELGVSRTPVREALSRLEQEGLVHMIPRRGAFVVRKTKKEILEMICVWGALESLAARLATAQASDEQLAALRQMFVTFEDSERASAHIDEYSERNIRFHQAIIRLSKCTLLAEIAEGLFIHMHSIRARTIRERDRVSESVIDHLHIIEALEKRDAELAERLVREHTNDLRQHVNDYVDWLE